MTSIKYTDEELNYFRVCKVTTHIITDGLRTVFKQEWDNRYKATHGHWQNTAKNGIDFYGMESPKNRKLKSRELSVMRNGNLNEWDCTCLFYGILYSDTIKPHLSATVKKRVDELRKFRNDVFAHRTDGRLPEAEFKAAINKAITAFKDLKLDTTDIEEIKNQTSFPTDELEDIKNQLEKEKKRNEEPRRFCVLPAKPSHETVYRPNEVGKVNKEMERLEKTKKNEVTVLYLSGNPGCGKSEVARQVGERFFDKSGTEMSFVMTLNAPTIDTLLQSYVEFAGRLRCDEEMVVKISTSASLSKERKMNDLRSLIAPRMEGYSSWLMILDNVSDLKSVSKYWPQAGERTSGAGQILVTTQDSSSIPTDSYTYHLSLKQGMNLDDAISTLSRVSESSAEESILHEVVKALDFQPLALACAVVYMQLIQSTDWTKYLEKLKEGKREATEAAYKKTSSAYPATMTEAVRMAVEKVANKDEVMRYAFQFLSVIAAESISLNYVVQYVLTCLPDEDEDLVASTVCSSSLVLSSDKEESKYIHVHQVLHSCLQSTLNTGEGGFEVDIIWDAVLAFMPLISEDLEDLFVDVEEIVEAKRLIVHFSSISSKIRHIFEQNPGDLTISEETNIFHIITSLIYVADICSHHARYDDCEIFYKMSLKIQVDELYANCSLRAKTLNSLGRVFNNLGQDKDSERCSERESSLREITALLGKPPVQSQYAAENTSDSETPQEVFADDEDQDDEGQGDQDQGDEGQGDQDQDDEGQGDQDQDDEGQGDQDQGDEVDKLISEGNRLLDQKKFKEAMRVFEKALEIQKEMYCDSHPLVASTYNEIGKRLCLMKDYEDAKIYFEKALAIEDTIYDFIISILDSSIHVLAKIFWDKGEYENVEIYLEKATAVQEIKEKGNHPSLEYTLNYAARNLFMMGKYDEAKRCLEKNLTIQTRKTDNETNLSLVDTLNILGETLREMGEYDDSRRHIEKALEIERIASGEIHPTLRNLGKTYVEIGQLNQAIKCYKEALSVEENAEIKKGSGLVDTLNELGDALRLVGKYKEAETYLKRAENIHQVQFRKATNPNLANTLKTLGDVLYDEGKSVIAKTCLEKALAIQVNAYNVMHPGLTDTLHTLSDILCNMGNYEEAKLNLEKALTNQKLAFHDEHPDVATTLVKLAELCVDTGQYKDAEQHLNNAIAIQEKAYAPEHPELADTLKNLGKLNQKMGHYKTAKKHLNRALTIQEKTYGKKHQHLADTLNHLGNLYQEKGQYQTAKKHLKRALTIQEKAYGKDHQWLVDTLNNQGKLCLEMGQYEVAQEHLCRALTIQEHVYGKEHQELSDTLVNLGELYHVMGLYDDAEQHFKRALTIQEKAYGQEHQSLSDTLEKLGNLYCDMPNRCEAAKEHLDKALAVQEGAFGKVHPNLAHTLNNLGKFYRLMGQGEDAEKILKRALNIEENVFGEEHPNVADTLDDLGDLYRVMRRYEDAETELNRALNIKSSAFGKKHQEFAATLNSLGDLRRDMDRHEDAKKLFRRALTIEEKVYGKKNPKITKSLDKLENLCRAMKNSNEAQKYKDRRLAILRNNGLPTVATRGLKRTSDEQDNHGETKAKIAKRSEDNTPID